MNLEGLESTWKILESMVSPEEYGKSKENLESTIKFTIQLIRMGTRCVPFLIALSLSLGTVLFLGPFSELSYCSPSNAFQQEKANSDFNKR